MVFTGVRVWGLQHRVLNLGSQAISGSGVVV